MSEAHAAGVPSIRSIVLRSTSAAGVFAILHSLMATESSKELAARLLGSRLRNGLYRLCYNAMAAASLIALFGVLRSTPDREFYRVSGTARLPLEIARLLLVLAIAESVREMGIRQFSGVADFRAYFESKASSGEPEAQEPPQQGGHIVVTGLYRWTRHPLNFSLAVLLLLTPRMTVVRLTLALSTLAYALVGSRLEERRLLRLYPEQYSRYQRSGVPFFLPRLPVRTPHV